MVTLGLLRWFYIFALAALGAVLPLLGARLEAAGFGGVALGGLMALLPIGRLVSAPAWAWAADRWRIAGVLLRAGCGVAFVGTLLLLLTSDPVPVAIGLLLFSIGRAPMGPLVDALTLEALGERARGEYGRVRLWGSVGFLVTAFTSGELSELLGLDPLYLGVALTGASFACASLFPKGGSGGPAPVLPALRALLREPFLLPFLATGFLQALTLSVYDTFFSAHVRALGLPATVTGAAIVAGVMVEVGLMRGAGWVLARWGAPRVLLAAALAGIPRWALTAWVTDPTALVAVQVLHGVTFGAFWIAGVQVMAERAPAHVSASAQSLFSAVSYGFGALLGALLAGQARARFGTPAIFEMLCVVSALASVTAVLFVRADRRVAAAA